ncbi:MAG: hypothetical protein KF764_21310 [Labilithrix sp.]|nr:hypothetical protein [Labilithrix sp.]
MPAPRVAAEPPAGWHATADVAKPKIADSAGASFTTWSAHRSEGGDATILSGCVATPIPGWVEDMRPPVEARTVALAGASAAAVTGAPVDARAGDDGLLDLRAASDLARPPLGRARTFIGFDEARVFTCFAACVSNAGGERRPCDAAVAEARLEGSLAPPAPGLALRGATWAVHHPRPTAVGAGGLAVALGLLAVVLRRRPRSRMAARRPARD